MVPVLRGAPQSLMYIHNVVSLQGVIFLLCHHYCAMRIIRRHQTRRAPSLAKNSQRSCVGCYQR